ncbi:MAG: zinc ribbon domain-containing protein [Thermoplasmata archaeon]|nr:zinc ribbon domain-containing protein [Thermoplasmata archaeon]
MSDQNGAIGMFRRWAAGSKKAKDLDRLAQISSIKKQYFPVYLFKRDNQGVEQIFIEPAASTTLPGLHSLKVPAGDLKIFDEKFDVGSTEMIKPDIEMLSYLNSLPGKPKEQALVYFPIWNMDYTFEGKKYNAVIDGVSGEVFSGEFPVRSSAPYLLVAIAGFLAFVAEGFLATYNLMIALPLMAFTAIAIFFIALTVARRM